MFHNRSKNHIPLSTQCILYWLPGAGEKGQKEKGRERQRLLIIAVLKNLNII